MRVLVGDPRVWTPQPGGVAVSVGVFDGVHLGHRQMLQELFDDTAALADIPIGAITFDRHPLKVIRPSGAPLMLTSTDHKLALISACDLDGCVMLPFTQELATMPASEFAAWLLRCAPTLSEIIVGENWRFGAKASGTPDLLRELGSEARPHHRLIEAFNELAEVI